MKKEISSHEADTSEDKIVGPSNRSFGLTVGGIFLAIAAARSWWVGELTTFVTVCLVIGAPLVILAAVAPGTLTLLNRGWMQLGVLLAKVMNPVIMFLVFIFAVTPTALIRRVLGYDTLRLKDNPKTTSYWVTRDGKREGESSLKNQF